MRSLALALALVALTISAARADEAADHDGLRALKAGILKAINTRDVGAIETIAHKPFLATVITQDSFTDAGALKAYYEGLFTRTFLRMAKVEMAAEADELSQIYTGTFAVARGSTTETYELTDGRRFEMKGRWTATAIKEDGVWKLLAIHDGTSFLDNPVLAAIEKSTLKVGAIGGALGVVIGLGLGLLVSRRRR